MEKAHLEKLLNREVQIYKGGPEANVGKLMDVKDDYLVLQTDNGETIFYAHEHIKSITENAQARFNSIVTPNSNNTNTDEETSKLDYTGANNLSELAKIMKNQLVRIDRGGPESRTGTLLEVNGDFLILYTNEDGLIFYNKRHIKSLSAAVNNQKEDNEGNAESAENTETAESAEESVENTDQQLDNLMTIYDDIAADNFHNLLKNVKYTWVKLNQGGPESVEGLLVDSNEEHLLLAVNNAILRIPIYHLKNFSIKLNNQGSSENSENENTENNVNNEGNKEDKDKNSKDKDKKDKDKKDKKDKNKKDKDKKDKDKKDKD
jgi:spore coat protein B